MGKANISGKRMKALCLLCCLVYCVSYLTRLNYAVCMVEIQAVLQIGKLMARGRSYADSWETGTSRGK